MESKQLVLTEQEAIAKAEQELSTSRYIAECTRNPGMRAIHDKRCSWLSVIVSLAKKSAAVDGATVQEWISVDERKPDLIPCGAGTAYSEAVNVLTDGRKVLTAIWNGSYWICDAEFWDAEFEEITHWAPVLLPLPQPPKGE